MNSPSQLIVERASLVIDSRPTAYEIEEEAEKGRQTDRYIRLIYNTNNTSEREREGERERERERVRERERERGREKE